MNRQLFNAMMAQYATRSVSGNGLLSWDGGVKCVIPSVKLYGAAAQDGTPTPDTPVMPVCNNGVFRATDADGAYDGGQAQAPELWAIPGTDYRDEWDAQTGKGIRRIKKIVFTGKESLVLGTDAISFEIASAPTFNQYALNCACTHLRAYAWENLWLGRNSQDTQGCAASKNYIRIINNVDDWDVNAARAYFAEQYAAGTPVTVWYALATPEPFASPPAKLTQPRGFGQIVQTGGDVADCPIKARYLAHC